MCIVSAIADDFRKRWPTLPEDAGWPKPGVLPSTAPWVFPNPKKTPFMTIPKETVSKEEFDKLKKELEELKKLIQAAKIFDENTGQKDCEMEEKIRFLRKAAELVGVDFDDVFPQDPSTMM
jgi:hypothetical protein